ncbi:hypothetical protein ACTNET_03845 [Lactobacillus amylovorus]|uniref:hypothetical protein n=1 Tax=Lactobacillus amylovorus TaxID=1604 RepID=UPI00232CBACF|nr:hypothetical protein [Lactobacillus amylovorus]MDB6229184.1 hypothetical protein [Lactobacillus amylovorus]
MNRLSVNNLEVGTRGTLKEFKKAHTVRFLQRYGYKEYSYQIFNPIPIVLAETVKTKFGELVIHDSDVLTYVGDKKWSVSRK